MRVFVTGGTGMLGSNLARALVERSDDVAVLGRSAKKAQEQLDDSVHVVVGDLDEIDGVFHTAAYFRDYYAPGDHRPTLLRRNVEATEQLLREAQQHGGQRLVRTSSPGVIGAGPNGTPSTGDTPPQPRSVTYCNAYFPLEAHGRRAGAAVLRRGRPPARHHRAPGLDTRALRRHPDVVGQLVLNFLAGKLPANTCPGTNVADARDVAAGMIAAADHDDPAASGDRYLLGGPRTMLVDITSTLAGVTGRRRSRRTIPAPVAIAAARIEERLARITRHTPRSNFDALDTLGAHPGRLRQRHEHARGHLPSTGRHPRRRSREAAPRRLRADPRRATHRGES